MDLELNDKKDERSSASQEDKLNDQREICTLADIYRETMLSDLGSLEVERESPASKRLVSVIYTLTLGVAGSLVASIVYELYLGRILRTLLG